MFKKTILSSAILLTISTATFAHTGFKGEKFATEAAPVAQTNYTASSAVPYVGIGLGEQSTGSYNGLIGNIFAGYGKKVGTTENIYLGGEIFGELGSIPLSHNQRGNRTTYGLGATFIPGFMVAENTMLYGRVGVKASHFKGTNNTHTGGQLGAGVQTAISKSFDLRGEYVYTGYGIVKNLFKAETNQLNVGLVYKFN